MSLASLIRSAVATADKVTKTLQDSTVLIYPWINSDDNGGPLYDDPISVDAIVEEKQMLRRMSDGQEVMQKASITIPRPIADNGAANRREPIDPRDSIVLPSGYRGIILAVNGVIDPSTHNPYMFQIILG
jgi:hypothetical protein